MSRRFTYLCQLAPVQGMSSVVLEDENIVYLGLVPDHAVYTK
jgi:hypothetical protein